MIGNEIRIKLGEGKHQKWLRLLLYMQNSPNASFTMKFDDYDQARVTYQRLYRAMWDKPSWFNLQLFMRGNDVYVIKPDKVPKVVIVDG